MSADGTPAADDPVAIVHLVPQHVWHASAAISGSRRGLELLRDAVDRALATGSGVAEVMADDGEGYGLVVMREGPDTMAEWDVVDVDRGLPYTADPARVAPGDAFWPRVDRILREARAVR